METTNKNDEIEINLREIFMILLDKLAVIILIAVLGAAVAFTYTKFMIAPSYQSVTQVYVTNNSPTTEQINVNELQAGSYLTKDYRVVIKSTPVLEQVKSNLKLNMSVEELAGKISVEIPIDTRILRISVVDSDPFTAKNIADAVREASRNRIMDVMGIEMVNTIEEGNLPDKPIGPNMKLNVLIGFMLGLIIAAAVVIIRFMLDDTIKVQEDVEKYLGISVLGLIPDIETADSKKKKKKRKVR
ncbi:MAG: protein-tyrosine kinase [Lachnospiraceae bacterium]|nr:protein-tyrosine kinase [Lachnospiraceae bacterium]